MAFTPEQNALLAAPLDPKNIVKPTGRFGAKGDYIEGWHAIAEANRIFGHDGWSYSINLIQDSLVHGEDSEGKPQWQAAYSCICSVTAGGVERQDVGFGSGFAKQVGDAIEGATKEAATDALKRALRTFGHPFGLALYDKKRANVGVPEAPRVEYDLNGATDQIHACETQMALKRWWTDNGEKIPDDVYTIIVEEYEKRAAAIKAMDRVAA